ncbi:translocation/assembly module TamB domain-containing protein [Pararhodonellum marinum]|uniref:translocation/assembly module TamB domain-containing protein n=1 Tax=Pararhodonellum marinum TaxID=2755358 RepID=UPI001890AC30|nr:translocation/assembly module TamB domain-containing protein [Pararhodonellum marinum]
MLFVRSPWGQDIIVGKAISYYTEKTGTKAEIDRLFITFSGNLFLEGLYLEDQQGDTLLYSGELEAGVELIPLVRRGEINLTKLEWKGLRANISRQEGNSEFNYGFILDAFTGDTETEDAVTEEDSAPSPFPQISLSPIKLEDFIIHYQDEEMGMLAAIELGSFRLDMPRMDLNKMEFYLKDLVIENSDLRYIQTKPLPPSDNEDAETVMPLVIVDNFNVEQVNLLYDAEPDGLKADVNLGQLKIKIPEADLVNQKILVSQFSLFESAIEIQMTDTNGQIAEEGLDDSNEFEFAWPEWHVEIGSISLLDNDFAFQTNDKKSISGFFDPENLRLDQIQLEVNNLFLKNQTAGLDLERLEFREQSGFELQKSTLQIKMDDRQLGLKELEIQTNRSRLVGSLAMRYNDIQTFLEQPESSNLDLNISSILIDVRDAFYFSPELRKDPLLAEISANNLKGSLQIRGSMDLMEVRTFDLNWGNQTTFGLEGKIRHAMDFDRLELDLPMIQFSSRGEDLRKFVNETEYGVTFPDSIRLDGAFKGALDKFVTQMELVTSDGDVSVIGNFDLQNQIALDGTVKLKDIQLQHLLNNEQLGPLSSTIEVTGQGDSIEAFDGEFAVSFDALEFNQYDFSNLLLEGNIQSGQGDLVLNYKDDNLDMDLTGDFVLDSIAPTLQFDLDLRGANLLALGITQKDIRISLDLNLDFEGNADSFDLKGTIRDGTVVFDDRNYGTGDFDLAISVQEDSTQMEINSRIINAQLASNSSPEQISAALNQQVRNYFRDERIMDSTLMGVEMFLNLTFNSSPIIDEVFLEGLNRLDSVNVKVDFKAATSFLEARIDLPFVDYAGIEVDSLMFLVDMDEENFDFNFGLHSLVYGPVDLGRTYFEGVLANRQLNLDFISWDEDEKLVHVGSDIQFQRDSLLFHIVPEDLIFNKRDWSIPVSNRILLAENWIAFQDFVLERNNQRMDISQRENNEGGEDILINFQDFRLGTFTSLFNPDELIAKGTLEGDFTLTNPFGAMGFLADLAVKEFEALGIPLGNLSLDAESSSLNNYDFSLSLKGGDVDLNLDGEFEADQEAATIDIDLNLNSLQLSMLEKLTDGEIREGSGELSGKFKVQGTTTDPIYEGAFNFKEAGFNIAMINMLYNLSDESIRLDNDGIYLENFTIRDKEDNLFDIDGSIFTEDLTNPSFDLKLKAGDFSLLNSTREDNDLFYGTANIDADITITGNLNLPEVDARLKVNEGTALTLVIPESQLDLVEREGVVLFINRNNPDDILTQRSQESSMSGYTGYRVKSLLEVSPDATFRVIVDERTGDNLEIAGKGNLSVDLDPNGRISMSGGYELTRGHYEMSFYNLVNRRFEIDPGSTIRWRGEPLDADLDLAAIYKVRTNAQSLMATQLTGADNTVSTQFRQELNFRVYLQVGGELMKPEISFRLDMEENDRGAFGGSVYDRLQQLNQEESDLNKQVVSLLVLNQFMPDTGNDGSGGGTVSLARSSVSQVLSGQLNALSGRLLGGTGVELDFDLDSYTDFQGGAPEDRTQLNVSARRRFMDDRLVVQVGSQMDLEGSSQVDADAAGVFGNVSVEYLLTETGRTRLRIYRKNEFVSLVDGQLIITGIGLIYQREFNRFKELFRKEVEESIIQSDENQESENGKEEEEDENK